MDNTTRSLVARVWKNEALELDAGEHYFDEVVTLHVSGTVTKHADQMAAPTTSLPLIPILALFWEKCGVSRDHALRMLRDAITEAMENGKSKDAPGRRLAFAADTSHRDEQQPTAGGQLPSSSQTRSQTRSYLRPVGLTV